MKKRTDLEIIKTIAEHRIVSISQATQLLFSSLATARRRLKRMDNEGLIKRHQGLLDGRHGRPEMLVSLTEKGLRELGNPESPPPIELPSSIPHQLLENWVRIKLRLLPSVYPSLRVRYRSASSACLTTSIPQRKTKDPTKVFIPDGVFAITDTTTGKSLLFFLEVDQSTEALAIDAPTSLRNKIQNYRVYRAGNHYKEYEAIFSASFNGFRLLFVTVSDSHKLKIAQLIRYMSPSDLVWVTDELSLLENGIHEAIWIRGGNTDQAPQSILGSIHNSQKR